MHNKAEAEFAVYTAHYCGASQCDQIALTKLRYVIQSICGVCTGESLPGASNVLALSPTLIMEQVS